MQDYLLDGDYDLAIDNGDFIVSESTNQHQRLLLLLNKGELRQYPKTGVGAITYSNDDQLGALYTEIQQQFEADGMQIQKLVVNSNGTIDIKARYGNI